MRDDKYYHFELFKSTGAGGQKKNKTLSAIKCIHLPTGIKQERDSRSQSKNKIDAKNAVNKILDERIHNECHFKRNNNRSSMIGSGMRGDKIRTYRFQDDRVTDHITGKSAKLKNLMRGNINKLWNK